MTECSELINNPKWVDRMNRYFDCIDLDHDGKTTIEEIQEGASNVEKICKAPPEKMKNLREQLSEFWGEIGLQRGVNMQKDEFAKGVCKLGVEEMKRKKNGETTYHEKLINAFFDVIDSDSNGVVTLKELQTILVATNRDPSCAEHWLEIADANKDGVVERDELRDSYFDFWWNADPSADIFGGK